MYTARTPPPRDAQLPPGFDDQGVFSRSFTDPNRYRTNIVSEVNPYVAWKQSIWKTICGHPTYIGQHGNNVQSTSPTLKKDLVPFVAPELIPRLTNKRVTDRSLVTRTCFQTVTVLTPNTTDTNIFPSRNNTTSVDLRLF